MDLGEPAAYSVLSPGTAVYSSEGQEIGQVTHVLADEAEDVFDGIVIGEQGHGKQHRFADADDVQAIFERGVVLKLDTAACDQLPEPTANPLVKQDGLVISNSEYRHQKLARAWDLISGKY
jgi:uncharacterized protein YrrD